MSICGFIYLQKKKFMNKRYSVDWFSGNIPKFEMLLNSFISKENLHFLEVGSFEGRSSCWFIDKYILNSANSTLTCVDTWQGSMEHTDQQKLQIWDTFNWNISSYPKEKVIVKRGISRDLLKTLPSDSYDFIYIDGSHTTRDVLEDAVLAFDLLKVNGIMTFDDYHWNAYPDPLLNPETGINSFLKCYAHQLNIIESSNQISIIKRSN